jgi:hypothetical protein
MDVLRTIKQETVNDLLLGDKPPFLVVAFYRDGEVETFATPESIATEKQPPVRSADIYLQSFLGSNQVTVAYSEDTSRAPKQTALGIWYTSGGQYKCRAYLSIEK